MEWDNEIENEKYKNDRLPTYLRMLSYSENSIHQTFTRLNAMVLTLSAGLFYYFSEYSSVGEIRFWGLILLTIAIATILISLYITFYLLTIHSNLIHQKLTLLELEKFNDYHEMMKKSSFNRFERILKRMNDYVFSFIPLISLLISMVLALIDAI